MQELTDRLEVFAPVYIIFTKADLISGFSEFFSDSDQRERDRVWGATLPYGAEENRDVLALFDERFDELYEGLKEMGTAQISLRNNRDLPPGLLTFPLEFAGIKPALRTFLSTLFETNPFQYKPVFRGFYFTSALQEGVSQSTSTERLARDASTCARPRAASPQRVLAQRLLPARPLFQRDLRRQETGAPARQPGQDPHALPDLLRPGAGAGPGAGAAGAGRHLGNQLAAERCRPTLDKLVRLRGRGRADLQARLEAMEILQDRIEQLDRYSSSRPWSLGLGLYQGDVLKERLLAEYYNGARQFMLSPVKVSLEDFLAKVDMSGNAAAGGAPKPAPQALRAAHGAGGDTLFQDASPTNADDAYNALKTYLMMANRQHVDPTHLSDQITRFWRGWLETNRGAMPRDQLIRSAERLISFYVSRAPDAGWPQIDTNLALVEKTRASHHARQRGTELCRRANAPTPRSRRAPPRASRP